MTGTPLCQKLVRETEFCLVFIVIVQRRKPFVRSKRFATSLHFALIIFATAFVGGCGDSANSPPPVQEVVKLSPEQEFAALLKKAEFGDVDAQTSLAVRYATGEGVAKDLVRAAEWFQKAAAQGNAKAQVSLGEMYDAGDGVTKDLAKAAELWQMAAAQGSAIAQARLGSMFYSGEGVKKNRAIAVEWWQKAAAQGNDDAQLRLGFSYSDGDGVPKNRGKAIELWLKAAEQGNVIAQSLVAGAYYTGVGLPEDAAKAMEWWQKAAAQGDDLAQSYLGLGYGTGYGVPKDRVLGYAWLNLSSKSNPFNASLRDSFENQLSSAEKAEGQRLSSNWKKGQTLAREGQLGGSVAGAQSPAGQVSKQGTGTAFFVSNITQAITNHHVINGCKEVRAEGRDGLVKVITSDVINDVALVQVPGAANSTALINSASTKLRQGEDVVVYGFPLNSVLSSGGNLTPGVVSALTGLGNNTNQIQITAPIQPGSSGSPVLNKKGEVVGVVSMKLDDGKMAKVTGQVGQNVNFAVSGQTLKTFLDAHKVEYSTGAFFSREKSAADLADEARKWTFVIECWK